MNDQMLDHTIIVSILRTVAYYDLRHYPLTLSQLWYYLERVANGQPGAFTLSLKELEYALKHDPLLTRYLSFEQGFIIYKSDSDPAQIRSDLSLASRPHWNKVRRFSRLLTALPFIETICVSGSLAIDQSSPSSDIDLFIVTSPKRIWTVRFLTITLARLLGSYRSKGGIAGKFCLNHYVSAEASELDRKNLYTARLFSQLVVVYSLAGYRSFQRANLWIADHVQRFPWYNLPPFPVLEDTYPYVWLKRLSAKLFSGALGDFLERRWKKLQLRHIERDQRRLLPGAQVVLEDTCLRFHLKAQEPVILKDYATRINALDMTY